LVYVLIQKNAFIDNRAQKNDSDEEFEATYLDIKYDKDLSSIIVLLMATVLALINAAAGCTA
jgi:hypothetical protein